MWHFVTASLLLPLYNHHANANQVWYELLNETPGRVGPPIGKPPESIRQYFHDWLEQDELAQDPDSPIRKYRVVFAEGRGVLWEVDKTFNAQRGIEVLGVERWARENLK